MTPDPGLPLTTGEGNTAGKARYLRVARALDLGLQAWRKTPSRAQFWDATDALHEIEAECGRLREQLDAARQALARQMWLADALDKGFVDLHEAATQWDNEELLSETYDDYIARAVLAAATPDTPPKDRDG